jgi:choline-sulfatase
LFEDLNAEWDDTAFCEYCTENGCLQRMIRKGPWKLNYFHGQPPQLFNLDEDPREMNDRAADPGCSDIVEELNNRVLEEWDPTRIWQTIQTKSKESRVLTQWTRNTRPRDIHRWDLRPEMDYLE